MYIIIEMQTDGNTAIPPITTYEDLNMAYSKYYSVLAAVAVSKVPIHTVMLLTEKGEVVRVESFEHPVEEEPEEEPTEPETPVEE